MNDARNTPAFIPRHFAFILLLAACATSPEVVRYAQAGGPVRVNVEIADSP